MEYSTNVNTVLNVNEKNSFKNKKKENNSVRDSTRFISKIRKIFTV